MTAAQLSPIFRSVAFVLIAIGTMASEFLDLRRAGMLLALGGIACLGAWACAAYISWEHGDD